MKLLTPKIEITHPFWVKTTELKIKNLNLDKKIKFTTLIIINLTDVLKHEIEITHPFWVKTTELKIKN